MKKYRQPQWLILVLFPLVLFYYEAVFRIATLRSFFQSGTLFTLLFCFAYGGIGYLVSTIFKNKKCNWIIATVYIGLSAVPYLIQYFVYRQFKIFYDLNTMFGGAGDALTSYFHEIVRMVFSWSGMLVIILLLLPTVLYLIFGRRYAAPAQSYATRRLLVCICMVECFVLSILGISTSTTLSPIASEQYSFQSAVSHFGLLTGLGLDAKENMFSSATVGFESTPTLPEMPTLPQPTQPDDPTDPTDDTTPPVTEPPIVYTPNELDIDFAALAESTSGTVKELNSYVAGLTATMKNEYTGLFEGKNLILITAEAFCAEVIDPELTPTLYRLATKGINFTNYYQPAGAGTTGGEYQNIFGMLPTAGGQSFKNTVGHLNYFTMGSQLDRLGYYGKAFHNNSYTYYSRNKTHNNLGYSDGFMGMGNGMEKYVTNAWPQSDLEMFQGTLPTYIDNQPFNVYYMTVSGHGNYSRTGNSMTKKNWSRVADLVYSDAVKGYLAANMELEDALTYLVNALEAAGIADDTVICLSADHFPYGLDDDAALGNMPYLSELYGYNVTDVFQRDHSRLILWCGELEDSDPIIVDSPTSSLDILPTLSNLFGTEFDSRLFPGRDVFSDAPALVFNLNYDWMTDYGTYYASSNKFVPTYDDITIPDGYVDAIKAIVRNKIRYCKGVLETDYFATLFS